MIMKLKRPAIAMIELIFAIVVLGIVMMSAPMLISTAVSTTSVVLQQASINEGVSRVSMILTYDWDENDINETCIPPVLNVSASGDSELNEVNGTGRRVGVPLTTNSRTFKCGITEFPASSLGLEGTIINDIDDFTSTALVVDSTGSGGKDYLEQSTINLATSINYAPDAASYANSSFAYGFSPGAGGSNSTNIKAVQVTVTSTEFTDRSIVLNAFSCNIGGYSFEERVMP